MIFVLVACLAGAALLLTKLWKDGKTEIVTLRNQVASLKRQLKNGRS